MLRWKNNKLLVLAALGAMMFPAGVIHATQTNMGGTATFLGAISLTPTNIQWGKVTYAAAPGASDTATVNPDDSTAYAGTFAYGGGTVAAGFVDVSGTNGNVMTASCGTSGTLANAAGTTTIAFNQVKIAKESTRGTAVSCSGVGTSVLTFTLGASDDRVYVGGRIIGPSAGAAWAGGAFSTGNTNGVPVVVEILYQ